MLHSPVGSRTAPMGELSLRETAEKADLELIWELLLEPVIRSGDSFRLPPEATREEAVAYWAAPGHRIFVAELEKGLEVELPPPPPPPAPPPAAESAPAAAPAPAAEAAPAADVVPADELEPAVPTPATRRDYQLGSYYLAPQQGHCSHIATCAFVTHPAAGGKGVEEEMLSHALQTAAVDGYRAVQFDFVVSTNEGAVELYKSAGFLEVGRLPGAFAHPTNGFVDALIMHKVLGQDDLSGWIRHNRNAGPSTPGLEPEDDGEEELKLIREIRSGSKLPNAQKLPAPEPEVVLDEFGYEAGKWDLAHLLNKAAYHLDTMFLSKSVTRDPNLIEESEVPTYDPC